MLQKIALFMVVVCGLSLFASAAEARCRRHRGCNACSKCESKARFTHRFHAAARCGGNHCNN